MYMQIYELEKDNWDGDEAKPAAAAPSGGSTGNIEDLGGDDLAMYMQIYELEKDNWDGEEGKEAAPPAKKEKKKGGDKAKKKGKDNIDKYYSVFVRRNQFGMWILT